MEAIKVVKENGDVNFFGGFDHLVVKQARWGRSGNGRIVIRIGEGAPFTKGVETHLPDKIIFYKGGVDDIKDDDPCRVFMLNSPTNFRIIATDAKVFVLGSNGKTIDTFH